MQQVSRTNTFNQNQLDSQNRFISKTTLIKDNQNMMQKSQSTDNMFFSYNMDIRGKSGNTGMSFKS